jgi:hypothetical protein
LKKKKKFHGCPFFFFFLRQLLFLHFQIEKSIPPLKLMISLSWVPFQEQDFYL